MIKSDNYYRRKDLMKSLVMPTMSDIKEELGEPLANVFFEECPSALQEEIGLTPPLMGPGEDLWTSPSDLLIGKVVLKPPLTTKYVKALTHEGILTIGQQVEIKYQNEVEMEKQRVLKEQERRLLAEAERKQQQAILATRKDEQKAQEDKIEQLREEFAQMLENQIFEAERRLYEEYASKFNKEKEELNREWEERLEEATEETTTILTKKFVEELAIQERELTLNFELRLAKQIIDNKFTLEEEQNRCKSTLRSLQHNLECKNIANMMYVLCIERKKCKYERDIIHHQYQSKIKNLEKLLKDKSDAFDLLTNERDTLDQKLNIREELVCNILKQFQKFINYALRASPTQAEFLLDIERMMTYELTQALVAADPSRSKHLCDNLMKWKKEQIVTPPPSVADTNEPHDCLNLISPPPSSSNISESDFLPAMFYKKGMYMREDFRNMLSQGKTISQDNLLWNREVENLIQIFRKVSKCSMRDSVDDELINQHPKMKRSRSQQSAFSSVHFGKSSASPSVVNDSVHKKMRSIMSTMGNGEEHILDKVQYATVDSLGLLCAKDSLTKHRESLLSDGNKLGSVSDREQQIDVLSLSKCSYKQGSKDRQSTICKDQESQKIVVDEVDESTPLDEKDSSNIPSTESRLTLARDSIVLRRLSMKQEVIIPEEINDDMPENEFPPRKNSRLSLARDSIILRKLSLGFADSPLITPPIPTVAISAEEPISEIPEEPLAVTKPRHSSIDSAAKSYLEFFLGSQKSLDMKSRLTMHQDSLEIIRDHRSRSPSLEQPLPEPESSDVIKPSHNNHRASVVTFTALPQVYETEKFNFSDSPWMIYNKSRTPSSDSNCTLKERSNRNKEGAAVLGDMDAIEHIQKPNEFASTRINSMLDILKNSPDLIKMFTGCSQ